MRERHDGFTAPKRKRFFKTLARTGCIADGARAAGVSTTVDRWRRKDPAFARRCEAAIDKAASHIEVLAWERAVTGIEEPVYHYGKFSHMQVKRSEGIFKLLLQASNPEKYGRQGAVAARGSAGGEVDAKTRARIEAEHLKKLQREGWAKKPPRKSHREQKAEFDAIIEDIRQRHMKTGNWVETPEGAMISKADAEWIRREWRGT